MKRARTVESTIASELGLPERGVRAVVALLSDKNTVPFIARYRKEVSGGLDEVQIRAIEERRSYFEALETRRVAILAAIEEQGALSPELRAKIEAATSKVELEDLYLPYKKKRRTRAQMARERGLQALADRILQQPPSGNPRTEARAYVGKDVPDIDAALAGARDIVAEVASESQEVRQAVRTLMARGVLRTKAARGKSKTKSKFEQYYEFGEPLSRIPSHRYLAIARGESEGFLSVRIELDEKRAERKIESLVALQSRSPFAGELRMAVADALKRLIAPSIESELRGELKEKSDRAAAIVFAENLANLLMAPPLGGQTVIAIDPGLRTGCKCAVLENTGKFVANTTLYLSGSSDAKERARTELAALVNRHRPTAIAVGNGTGGREALAFVRDVISVLDVGDIFVVAVSESGASIYSASDIAREEFPDLDLTVRGAISIGRRLQDPLAELVKVDPKSIGVGQYQHDVNQKLLGEKLREVVESCVNQVGVDLNTASAALLSYVAGVGTSIAKKIISHREKHGRFDSRKALLKVSGLGPKAFEQAAGFLRIRDAANPLDESAVHPERYELVARIATDLGVDLEALVGSSEHVSRIEIGRYKSGSVGEMTLRDIARELEKPGRDPRSEFEAPSFRDDVSEIDDLVTGMELEGIVTNVTAFGAFVDIGVHSDGLVHISQLADRFVKDPADVVKVGDRIKVHVLSVDLERKRIALSAKSQGTAPASPRSKPKDKTAKPKAKGKAKASGQRESFSNNPFANLKSK